MSFRRQNSKLLFESPSVSNGEEPELKRFDFDFERKLGDGAFGQVWRVRHKKTSQMYALKQVPKEKVSKMLPQFRREVYIMYEINHPHIIKLYNHFEDDKFFYLIMELAEGNLFHKLYREKHFLERVAAHIPAIIHRDIKPENILLDREGRIKLTDFGWSNYYSADVPTQRFTTCGTLEYIPPEMVEEKGHNTSADIWCLGILLYEMLIGSTPFKSTIRDQMLTNIRSTKPKFPLTLPSLAKDLILKMLEKDPSKRPMAEKIKEHQWMIDHSPIRPTITQELSPKKLPNLDSPKDVTGYIIISKEENNEKTPSKSKNIKNNLENKENKIINSPCNENSDIQTILNPYRQSIKHIKNELEEKNNETINARRMIQEKNIMIIKLQAQMKKTEEKIVQKRKEFALLASAEKDAFLELSDINLDLEKLVKFYNSKNTNEKINNQTVDFMEKTRECKKQQNYLHTLREDFKKIYQEAIDKEKILANLRNQLKQIKDETSSQVKEKKSKIEDVKINQEVLEIRLKNRVRFSKEFGKEEKKIAEEVKKILMNLSYAPNYEKKLEELVLKSQEKTIEKEQDLSNLLIFYEEKRSQIITNNRKKKDELSKNIWKVKENNKITENAENQKIINGLKEEISKSRKAINKLAASEEELSKVNLKYQVKKYLGNIKQARSNKYKNWKNTSIKGSK